jgi:hypothetical protein
VHIIDPKRVGQGEFDEDQPLFALLNTPFRGEFVDLLRDEGYRPDSSGGLFKESNGSEIPHLGFFPRALYGRWRTQKYEELLLSLPPGIRVHDDYHDVVDDLVSREGGGFIVYLHQGRSFHVDAAVLQTGRSRHRISNDDFQLEMDVASGRKTNPKLCFHRSPYPLLQLSVPKGSVIGVQGTGLTAYDVLAHLARMHGEFFRDGDGRLRYRLHDGSEGGLRLFLFSHKSLPYRSRRLAVDPWEAFVPKFLTSKRISDIQSGGDKYAENEFRRLLLLEIAYAYHSATMGDTRISPDQYRPSSEEELAAKWIVFPELTVMAGVVDQGGFNAAVRSYIENDLEHADHDLSDPMNAAIQAFAKCYDVLPKHIRSTFSQQLRRSGWAAGPAKIRNEELLALADAGILSFGPGPDPQISYSFADGCFTLRSTALPDVVELKLDGFVRAWLPGLIPSEEQAPLYQKLVERGDIQSDEVKTTNTGNVIDANGKTTLNFYAWGLSSNFIINNSSIRPAATRLASEIVRYISLWDFVQRNPVSDLSRESSTKSLPAKVLKTAARHGLRRAEQVDLESKVGRRDEIQRAPRRRGR